MVSPQPCDLKKVVYLRNMADTDNYVEVWSRLAGTTASRKQGQCLHIHAHRGYDDYRRHFDIAYMHVGQQHNVSSV